MDNIYYQNYVNISKMKIIKKIYTTILYTLAVFGGIMMLGYVASKAGLTNNGGTINNNTDYYSKSRNLVDNNNYVWLNTPEYLSQRNLKK